MEPDPIGQIVAANLKILRRKQRWTLRETADELAVYLDRKALTEGGLSRWENPASPRRFAMTELYAICRVFGVQLARLFLPDIDVDQELPTINDGPIFAVWEACFEGAETAKSDWQRVAFVQSSQLLPPGQRENRLDGFSDDEVAEAIELLRRARDQSEGSERGSGDHP